MPTAAIRDSVKRVAKLLRDISLVPNAANTRLSLGHEVVYDVTAAYKNGATMTRVSSGSPTSTQYLWHTYRPFVTVAATTADDHFLFAIQTKLSDTGVDDFIDEAEQEVFSALSSYYDVNGASFLTHDTIVHLVRDIAVGRIIEFTNSGATMENADWRAGFETLKAARELLNEIRLGSAQVLDSAGDPVAKTAGAVLGYFAHADGAVATRVDLRRRVAQYDSFGLAFYPRGYDNDPTTTDSDGGA